MAERRMFAKTIIDSDAFLDMPLTTQALYFHLSMRADDDGFVNNPRKIQRMLGCSEDDIKVLVAKQFLIPFDSGVVVIKHWRIHNYIRKDRYKETLYKQEKAEIVDTVNQLTTIGQPNDDQTATDSQPNDNQRSTQVRLGKVRLGKDKYIYMRHQHGAYKNVLLTDDEFEKLKKEFPDWESRIERLSEYMASTGKTYKNHLATIRSWARRDKKAAGAETMKVVDELAEFIERGGKDA